MREHFEIVHPPEEFHLFPFQEFEKLDEHHKSSAWGSYEDSGNNFLIDIFEQTDETEIFHRWVVPKAISKMIAWWVNNARQDGRNRVRDDIKSALGI